jgi:probable addiction module antidote protein
MTTWKTFDPADYLGDEAMIAAYLTACLEDDDGSLFIAALGDVARTTGMTKLAADTGLGRESLYKALSPGAHPRHETIRRVICALGLRLTVEPVLEKQGG